MGMSNIATTAAVPVGDLLAIRQALQGVLATHRGTSQKALDAVRKGREAYRLCFTMEDRQRVLDAAQAMQRAVPEGHYMRQVQMLSSFEQVLDELGMQFVEQVLGEPEGR